MNPTIQQTIARVRSRIRWGLAGETAARLLTGMAGFFFGWLLIDWALEPLPQVRVAAYIIAGIATLAWLLRTSLSALFTRLPDQRIAALIERRRPELADALLTAMNQSHPDTDSVTQRLVHSSHRRATDMLDDWDSPGVVDTARQKPWRAAAGLGVLSAALFVASCPATAGVYLRRLALSEEPWPRRVALSVEGFAPDDRGRLTKRIARGSALDLDVKASLANEHILPQEVWASVRNAEGVRTRQRLSAIGTPTTGENPHQAYSLKTDKLRNDLVLSLRGGDARLGPLYVRVVPRPAFKEVELEIEPPKYLDASSYRLPADAFEKAPEGASVTLLATSTKPLDRVAASYIQADAATELKAIVNENRQGFRIALPFPTTGGTVEVSLLDTDGIESGSPFRLPLRFERDPPPRIDFVLRGVGRAVTTDAVIHTLSTIADDHAIAHAAIQFAAGDRQHQFPLQPSPDSPASLQSAQSIDLLALRSDPAISLPRLEPGDRLQLLVSASDRYRIVGQEGPHVSTSQTEALTIVSADELVALLEQKETSLRGTFQHVYDEARGAELNATRLEDGPPDEAADDRARRRRLSLARLVGQLGKVTDETRAVAEGFAAIHDELTNNRIQNDDLKDRIDARIIRPLTKIASKRLPKLHTDIQAAAKSLDDSPNDPALDPLLQQRLASVVEDMRSALEEMKAVETYNEVLALLRGIIEEQRGLSRKTQDAKKSSLKRLLLD